MVRGGGAWGVVRGVWGVKRRAWRVVRGARACLRPVHGAVQLLCEPAQSRERCTRCGAMHGQQGAIRLVWTA